MGGEVQSAYVRIRPNLSGFAAEMRSGINTAFSSLDSTLNTSTGASQKLAASLDKVGASAKAAFGEAATSAKTSAATQVESAAAAADAQKKLQGKIVETGNVTADVGKKMSSAMSKAMGVMGVAFGAEVAVKGIKDLVNSAASVQKSAETITYGFGAAGKAVNEFNETAAAGMGISARAGEAAAAKFSILFHNMNIGGTQAAQMTLGLEKLAGSLSMIRGVDPTTALQSLSMAMLGNMRSLKQLGISFSQQQIAQEAVRLGLVHGVTATQAQQAADEKLAIAKARLQAVTAKYGQGTTQVAQAQLAFTAAQDKATAAVGKAAGALTPAEKAQSIYALATQNLASYQQQAAKHAGDLANVQMRLTAELSNAKEMLGTALIPMFNHVATALSNWIQKAQQTGALQRDINGVVRDATAIFSALSNVIRTGWSIFQTVAGWIGGTKQALVLLTYAIVAFKAQAVLASVLTSFANMGGAVNVVKDDVAALSTEMSTNMVAAATEGAAAVDTAMGSSGMMGSIAAAKTELQGFASSLARMSGAIIPITIALSMIPTSGQGAAVLDNTGMGWAGKIPFLKGVTTQAANFGNDIRGWLGMTKVATWTTAQADAARAAARAAVAGNPRQFINLAGQAQITSKAQAIKFAMAMAQSQGLDPQVFLRQINQESGFSFNAKSGVGATGIAQFMPDTAAGLGVNPLNPGSSLAGAAVMMKRLQNQYGGNLAYALAAYNAGSGRVNAYLAGRGVLPKETINYVNSILGGASPFNAGGAGGGAAGPSAASTAAAIAAATGGLHVGSASTVHAMTAKQLDTARTSMRDSYAKIKAEAGKLGPELTAKIKSEMRETSKAITNVADASDVAKAKQDLVQLRTDVQKHMTLLRQTIAQTKAFDALKQQVDKLGQDVPPAVKRQMTTIRDEMAKGVITPTGIAHLQQQMTRVKNEVAKTLTEIKAKIQSERGTFDTAFSQLASGIDSAFDSATQEAIRNMQVQVSAAGESFQFGGGITKTPAQIALESLQSQHTQAQDAAALATAQAALAKATTDYQTLVAGTAQDSTGALIVPTADVIAQAKDAITAAQQQLDDAIYNQKVNALSDQAALEQTAAATALQAAQDAYQKQRDALKAAMDQRLTIIEAAMANGNISSQQGMELLSSILGGAGVDVAGAGAAVGGTYYASLNNALIPVFGLLAKLQTDMKKAGLVVGGSAIVLPNPQALPGVFNPTAGATLSPDAVDKIIAAIQAGNFPLVQQLLANANGGGPASSVTVTTTDPNNIIQQAYR